MMPDFDIHPDHCQLLAIDVQERFSTAIPSITAGQSTHRHLSQLLQASQIFELPTTLTEQVPAKLGPTIDSVKAQAAHATVLNKSAFSCLDDRPIREHLATVDRPQVLVAGIEAHICVLSSVADLRQRGYRVCVASDAIASRNPEHCAQAIASMRQLGALCLPTESLVMRLQRCADSETFRAISKLIR